jgi:hypothetical protein
MVQARVKPRGKNHSELTLQIHLQEKSMWKDSWQSLDKIGNRVYLDFFDDVRIEAYRALYDRR